MPGVYNDVDLSAMGTSPPPSVSKPAPEQAPAQRDPAGASALGPLLTADDKTVFETIDKLVEAQEQLAKNREAARKHRGRVRAGIPFSVLNKDEDTNVWRAELPPGGSNQPSPIPNKADDLNRKIVSQVIVDLPQPDPKPATDNERDRGAADLAKRFLKTDGDESGTNDPELFRDVLDSAMTDASEFAHVWVDMQGGGWRPLQIKAHPQAMDPANPLVAQQPQMDEMTGQPVLNELGEPVMQDIPCTDYTLRYVSESGQFVESAAEAKQQWLPKIKRDVLGPQHVRTVPEIADVANAEGVILLMCGPVSDLKKRVPDLSPDVVQRLAEWKPRRHKVLVPTALRARLKEQQKAGDTITVDDNTLVFWYQKYCPSSGMYPDGADIYVSGVDGGLVLKRGTLRKDVETEEGVVVLLRDIPVSQCKALHDSESRDPFGKAPIDLFGQTNEGLAQLYGSVLEDTDKRLHPNVFIPSTSPVQDWQLATRNGAPIPVYGKDDMPMYEEFGDLPSFLPSVIELMETSMRETAGLNAVAQQLDSPNAVSGIAKQVEVNQAKVSLAPIAQNFFAFAKRYWRIKLEAAQAFLTVPQEVEYVGIDQAYKQRWFTGADFSGVKDVAIMAGTGTLMNPAEKQQYLSFAQQALWLDPDEAGEAGRSSIADDLGIQSSPSEDAIKRELSEWMKGPPQGWMAPQPQTDERGMPMMDPMGQPAMTPATSTPFTPRPTDEDPSVAKRQYKILRDFCYTGDYMKWPPEWRALLDQRVAQAQYAAGVQTVRQQAEAQQQQMQQESEAGEKERDSAREEKREERDNARSMRADEMEHEAAMQDRKQAGELSKLSLTRG